MHAHALTVVEISANWKGHLPHKPPTRELRKVAIRRDLHRSGFRPVIKGIESSTHTDPKDSAALQSFQQKYIKQASVVKVNF